MQPILDAASHIALEIERTRGQLAMLEKALEGLRPLITVESGESRLAVATSVQIESVEDISIISPPRKKKSTTKNKGKAAPKTASKAAPVSASIPNTGSEIFLKALGRKKHSRSEISDTVLKALGLGSEAKAVIQNRVGAWLTASVKKNQVASETNKAGVRVYSVVRG